MSQKVPSGLLAPTEQVCCDSLALCSQDIVFAYCAPRLRATAVFYSYQSLGDLAFLFGFSALSLTG